MKGSLKEDLKILELGNKYFPRFSKDTTDDEVKKILDDLKQTVRKQRDLLIIKYQDNPDINLETIKEINAAAERILDL
ncbi:MAG: hypothetical protein AB9873_00810 [Syntrophobacteraceae bacterium]